MTYYPDLSPFCYCGREPDTFNIGWLDGVHPFPIGSAPKGFLERLGPFLKTPVQPMFGMHTCELCGEASCTMESRVFGKGATLYAAPTMIYHYVLDHRYLPPAGFVQAVLTGPAPDSEEYRLRAQSYSWSWSIKWLERHAQKQETEDAGYIVDLQS